MTKAMFLRWGASAVVLMAAASAARADASPVSFAGDPVIAIGILVVLVVLVWLLIRGTLGIARRDKSDEDDAGVGILEGIDEDDDKPKRR